MNNLTRKIFAVCLTIFVLTGCVSVDVRPAGPFVDDYKFDAARDDVFQSALTSAQRMNLNIAVIEKDSGLIRFENASLDAQQLDQYTRYPVVQSGTQSAMDSFTGWNQRSVNAGAGTVRGQVSLTILTSEYGSGVNVNLKSNFSGGNNNESYTLGSKGVLENELISKMREQL